MTCAAVAAIVGAVTLHMGGDELVLAPHPTAKARVCYYNHGTQNSKGGDYTITMGDLTLNVALQVGHAETLTLGIPGHFQAFPADANPAKVMDGETLELLIIYPSS